MQDLDPRHLSMKLQNTNNCFVFFNPVNFGLLICLLATLEIKRNKEKRECKKKKQTEKGIMIRKSLLGFGIIGGATAGYMTYKHKTDEGFRRAIRFASECVCVCAFMCGRMYRDNIAIINADCTLWAGL